MEDSTDIKAIAARLQEIDEKARTKGEYNKIGEIYGFSIMVKTESTSKDLFDCSVNRFFVKGQESIYYTYNNGKLASDPKLACQNFINALERIPKVIESHEKEMEKVAANKDVYTNIAGSSWKKEEELRTLKGEAAELDRRIALTLAPPEEEKEDIGQEAQHGAIQQSKSVDDISEPRSYKNSFSKNTDNIPLPTSPKNNSQQNVSDNNDITSKVIISKPKWKM